MKAFTRTTRRTSTLASRVAVCAAAALIALAACSEGGVVSEPGSTSSASQTAKLAMAVFAQEASSLSQTLKSWAAAVTERTDGAVTFTFTYNAALLAADDTLQGVADGRADIGLVGALYYESQLPLTAISGEPYLAANAKAAMLALKELYKTSDAMKAEYDRNGVTPLFFLPARDALLGASDTPIESIEDLKGRSIRAVGTFAIALSEVGANPVSIVFNELYESLERGVVDSYSGVLLDSVEVAGLYEVAKYVSDPRQGLLSTYPISINNSVWGSLSEEVKAVMAEEADRALDKYFEIEAGAYTSSCNVIEAAGGSVTMWSDAASEAWADALGDTIIDTWRERVGADAADFETQYKEAMERFDASEGQPRDGVGECAERF